MGDWCNYEIKSVNNSNLPEMLVSRGFAAYDDNNVGCLRINIEKLSSTLYEQLVNEGHNREILVGYEKNPPAIKYSHKWGPDDRILDAISRAIPDEVLVVTRDFEWYEHLKFYEKNGENCNKCGTVCNKYLFVNSNLIRESFYGYAVSFPVGDISTISNKLRDNQHWGIVYFSSNDVIKDDGIAYVAFTKDSYKIRFGDEVVLLTKDELYEAYKESIEKYRDEMNETVRIDRNMAIDTVKRDENIMNCYYVCKFKCDRDFSENEIFSVCIPDYNVTDDYLIMGKYGSEMKAMVKKNGYNEIVRITIGKMKDMICENAEPHMTVEM